MQSLERTLKRLKQKIRQKGKSIAVGAKIHKTARSDIRYWLRSLFQLLELNDRSLLRQRIMEEHLEHAVDCLSDLGLEVVQ